MELQDLGSNMRNTATTTFYSEQQLLLCELKPLLSSLSLSSRLVGNTFTRHHA
jgi:hypothetical protein